MALLTELLGIGLLQRRLVDFSLLLLFSGCDGRAGGGPSGGLGGPKDRISQLMGDVRHGLRRSRGRPGDSLRVI